MNVENRKDDETKTPTVDLQSLKKQFFKWESPGRTHYQ